MYLKQLEIKMRVPWRPNFPPVLCHISWQSEDGGLADHTKYFPAKKRGDVAAASAVCFDLTQEDTMNEIFDICVDNEKRPPIIATPAMNALESKNVLAIGYAKFLGSEMGWEVASHIFQSKSVKRDFETNSWFRLVHQPEFYGFVEKGRRYIVVDDVCTMGGTLASLRGYIEQNGGDVICMSTIACKNGKTFDIAISERTLYGLSIKEDGAFALTIEKELGYDIKCLTEAEGRFLLRCPSSERLRKGINGVVNW